MTQFKNTPEQARRLWVEALRSGRYEQAHNCLEDENGNLCCLGVLVRTFMQHEPSIKIEVQKRTVGGEEEDQVIEILFDDESAMLPTVVQKWAALVGSGGEYKGDPDSPACALYTDNDDNGKTFHEIAAIIESAPPGLFVEATQ